MEAMTADERSMAELIVGALNLEDVRPEDIDPAAPLFGGGLGLDSIDALEIAVAIAQEYGVHLKAEDEETRSVFETLGNLARHVAEQAK